MRGTRERTQRVQPRVANSGRTIERLDMDDTLEQPKPNFNISGERDEDREQDSSGDEDGGLDWTKLPYVPPPSPSVVG
jgi:hypothetical protein